MENFNLFQLVATFLIFCLIKVLKSAKMTN